MNVEVKKLKAGDSAQFIEMLRVFEHVFEMKNFQIPDAMHFENLLKNENFFVFVALKENRIVGGLTAYVLQQYYSTGAVVYIYDLAVRTELQRQGIGKFLIDELKNFCKKRGIEEIFVQADAEDVHALDFYRSTGVWQRRCFILRMG